MPTDAEKREIEAEVAMVPDDEQVSTAHLPVDGDAPRGNVHSDEDEGDGDLPGEMPPPHGF